MTLVPLPGRQRQVDLSEFEDSLVYRVNSRLVRATKQTTCLAPRPPTRKKKIKRENQEFCFVFVLRLNSRPWVCQAWLQRAGLILRLDLKKIKWCQSVPMETKQLTLFISSPYQVTLPLPGKPSMQYSICISRTGPGEISNTLSNNLWCDFMDVWVEIKESF